MKLNSKKRLVGWIVPAVAATVSVVANAGVSIYPDQDVFDAPPPAASADGKPACQPAQRYIDTIAAGRYAEVGKLFAEDAVFVTPTGKVLRGSAEIGAFYAEMMPKIKPRNIPISFMADGDECIMELVSATNLDNYAHYRLAAIDHFTVNAQGKIRHLTVYLRPQSVQPTPKKE